MQIIANVFIFLLHVLGPIAIAYEILVFKFSTRYIYKWIHNPPPTDEKEREIMIGWELFNVGYSIWAGLCLLTLNWPFFGGLLLLQFIPKKWKSVKILRATAVISWILVSIALVRYANRP